MPHTTETWLPGTPDCARTARRFIDEHMAAELDPGAVDVLKRVTSELVTNAYIHGQGEIRLRLNRHTDRLQVEVINHGHDAVKIGEQGPDRGGSGLKTIDRFTFEWDPHDGTTHVWTEMPVDRQTAV